MPFPVDKKYVEWMENKLNVKFPEIYKSKMLRENGGEVVFGEYQFELYPFFDQTNRKRISRTCNHIEKETKSARGWNGFPEKAIAIGSDGFGNQLILAQEEDGTLGEAIFLWNHETSSVKKICNSIIEFENG